MKIIINNFYGGFCISEKAAKRYCELKGINYDKEWHNDFSVHGIKRTDPVLIQVVEELGEEANGSYSRLKIEEIPNGSYYRISEYDGWEDIILKEKDPYKWELAEDNEKINKKIKEI